MIVNFKDVYESVLCSWLETLHMLITSLENSDDNLLLYLLAFKKTKNEGTFHVFARSMNLLKMVSDS